MARRALRICAHPRCHRLQVEPYCAEHRIDRSEVRQKFDSLPRENRAFYDSRAWTDRSLLYRRKYPLCSRCESRGFVTPATLVHHTPDLSVLIARGDDPYDERWLQGLCNACHLEDLRARSRRPRLTTAEIVARSVGLHV